MMAAGVCAGAKKPTHEAALKSLTPLSAKVGTSGNELARWGLDTAMGLSLPDFTWL